MNCFALLFILISLSHASLMPRIEGKDFECNDTGYDEYLKIWSVEEKSFSRDPTSPEYSQRLQYFIENCMKIHEWNNKEVYKMEFTYYADWSADEFELLASSTQKYTGVKPNNPIIQIPYNNSEYRYLLPSLDPCDDILAGGNSLRTTINKPQNCSVSWAFAVTNSIEYAVKKFYLEEYNQEISIALSAQELIDCAGKEHGIENGCEGLPIAWGFEYALDNGIAYRQYYPQTNMKGECREIKSSLKYHIAGYEKPSAYNKYGLFELLQKGPVAVTLGLDPEYFQFYQNDNENGPYFNSGYYRPSVYGVVVEYNQYKEVGKEDYADLPFFAIETRLRACDSTIFRLPILDNEDNANIGGIAGFAIHPIVKNPIMTSFECSETIYPTIESIPAYATELIFEEGSYSSLAYLDLSRFTQVKTVIFGKNSFANANSLYIDNANLEELVFGDNCFGGISSSRRLDEDWFASHHHGLSIMNGGNLKSVTVKGNSMTSFDKIRLFNVSSDISFNVETSGLSNIGKIEIPISSNGISARDQAEIIRDAIINANPGMNIDIEEVDFFAVTPRGNLIIATEEDCSLLLENYWVNITVNAGLCNTMQTAIAIENNPFLVYIIIHKYSLQNLASFTINNNTLLNSIVIEDGDSASESAMRNVQTVSITSISLSFSFH